MDEKHITFDEALKAAQKLGYAEADPTMDVDGHDAAAPPVPRPTVETEYAIGMGS